MRQQDKAFARSDQPYCGGVADSLMRCGACRFWLPYVRDERWEGSGDCQNENLRGRIVGFDHTFGCVAFLPGRIADARWKK